MTIRGFLESCITALADTPLYSKEDACVLGRKIIREYLNLPEYAVYLEKDSVIEEVFSRYNVTGDVHKVTNKIDSALHQLSQGIPIQYIFGYEIFYGLKFNVSPSVLIPRPETEELVKLVKENTASIQTPCILDICTGSGCIAWTLAYLIGQAKVYGFDISKEAIEIAKNQDINHQSNKFFTAPEFFEADLFSPNLKDHISDLTVNVIVSNPPYVCDSEKNTMQTNVLDNEPSIALFVPDSDPLLFYKRIVSVADKLLPQGGMLFLEINERFGDEMSILLKGHFTSFKIIKDLFDKERFAFAVK